MKTATNVFFALIIVLVLLAMPLKGWARESEGDSSRDQHHAHQYRWRSHRGWYDRFSYLRYGDDDRGGGYSYRGYPGNAVCNLDFRCFPAPTTSPAWGYDYWPMDYAGPTTSGAVVPNSGL